MKTLLLIAILFTISSGDIFAQKNNELNIYYGSSTANLYRKPMDGGADYQVQKFNEIGIKYLRLVSENMHIVIGVNYSESDIKITPEYMGLPVVSRIEKTKIFSIPIYANYDFWKYMFINGGVILDFQTTDNSFDSQSGIGFSMGFGGKYSFNNFVIFVTPNYKIHSIIPFNKESHHQKLTEFGIQFGIGYQFGS